MAPRSLLSTAILLACCLRSVAQDPDLIPYLSDSTKNGLDIYRTDSVPYSEPDPPKKKSYYFILTPGIGVSTVFTPHNNGILNISFPYEVNGTPNTFNSGNKQPYGTSRIFAFPLGIEVGTWNQFIDFNFDWSVVKGSSQGVDLWVGYGRNFYLGGHSGNVEKKILVLKPSINFVWIQDGMPHSATKLGSIDNTGNTIEALGYTAGPTYDVTTDDYDDNGNIVSSSTSTNNASTFDIAYVQTQYAVRPEITLSNNQYRRMLHWELSLGYDITLYERGGISFRQDDGDNNIAHMLGLDHPGLTATYNGQRIYSTPYHFSGFYLRFALDFVLHRGNVL